MELPPAVERMLEALDEAGIEAYLVGGCVRDHLLGLTPKDYDIAAAAPPERTGEALERAGCRVYPTGIRHGTVTAVLDGLAVELTAYRADGEYADHRHPGSVRFVSDIKQDVLRRDFTCNALAYHPQKGLVDHVGGLEDLRAGLLRCVGEPEARFEEDALRILRALRFSAALGFAIEKKTAEALIRKAPLLHGIARERVSAELQGLVCGKAAPEVLTHFPGVLACCLPGLEAATEADFAAMAERLRALPPEPVLRLCPLVRLCGPRAEEALQALRLSARQEGALRLLLEEGDDLIEDMPALRRTLGRCGEERTRLLLLWQGGRALPLLREALEKGLCCSVHELHIRGGDLAALGLAGPAIGRTLNALLELVIRDEVPNKRESLLAAARELGGKDDGTQ